MPDTLDHSHHTRQVYDMTTLGRALARAVNEPAARDLLHLGTAAIWDVPETGDASTSQVVIGTDSRLTDARTPTAHTHATSDILGLGYYATGTDASYLTGTLADARLSSNVALKNADNAFSAAQTFSAAVGVGAAPGNYAINVEKNGTTAPYPILRLKDSSTNGHAWWLYSRTDGWFCLYDETASQYRLICDASGVFTLSGSAPSSVSAGQVAIGGGLVFATDGFQVPLSNVNGFAQRKIYGSESLGVIHVVGEGSSYDWFLSNRSGYPLLASAANSGFMAFHGSAPSYVAAGQVAIGGGSLRAYANIYAHTGIVCPNYGNTSWQLGVYVVTAPSATGYVTIKIDGTVYKLLAST